MNMSTVQWRGTDRVMDGSSLSSCTNVNHRHRKGFLVTMNRKE